MGMFISLTVNGLANGMVYALMAMGLVLLIRSVGCLNFAQGDLLMMGAYIAFGYIYMLKMPELIGLLLSFITYILFGVAFMFAFYWPVRKAKWGQAVMICTLGASLMLKDIANIVFGTSVKIADYIIPGSLKIGQVQLKYQNLIIIAVCLVVMLVVHLLYDKLYVGRIMQAASQDKYAAELLGIPVNFTIAATYALVMLIAGLDGYLVSPIFMITTTLSTIQLKAFAGAVIGGFGNLKGTIYGCILVGLLEAYSTYFTTTYKDLVIYGALILTLIIRPQGFFGETIAEKA